MKALSIRQPWAWAIIAGYKTIENRTWQTSYRGPLLIHAGKTLRPNDYDRMLQFGEEDGFSVPDIAALARGGIVGRVELVEIVTTANGNAWFGGPFGWRFENPRKMLFKPLVGQLKLFDVDVWRRPK